MFIDINMPQTTIKLKDVTPGTVFAYDSKAYLTTDRIEDPTNTVVDLFTGNLIDMPSDSNVIVLNNVKLVSTSINKQFSVPINGDLSDRIHLC